VPGGGGEVSRSTLLWVAVMLCAGLAPAQEPSAEALRPVSAREAAVPLLPVGSGGGSAELAAEAGCSDLQPGRAIVKLRWAPAVSQGLQRVDVTAYRDGFERGEFDVTPLLSEAATATVVDAVIPGLHYYWRVLRSSDAGWVPSETSRFEAPICPVDSKLESPEQEPGQ